MKAKFKCYSVQEFENQKKVTLTLSIHPEDNPDFVDGNLCGELNIYIEKDKPAWDYFTPGKYYDLNFTEINSPKNK